MKTEKNKPSRLTQALLETAKDMKDADLLNKANYEKITMRHIGLKNKTEIEPLTGKDIRMIREQAHMSQAVFCQIPQLNGRVRFTIGAWLKASDRRGARTAECDPPQRIEAIL